MNEMSDNHLELFQTQLDIEEQMSALGKDKILGSEERHFSNEKVILKTQVKRLADAIQNILIKDMTIDSIDKVEIAYDVLRALVTTVRNEENVMFACMTAGSFIKTRAYATICSKTFNKSLTDKLRRKANQVGRTERNRASVFRKLVQKEITKHEKRDNEWQLDIGREYVFQAIACLKDIFCLKFFMKNGKKKYQVIYTEYAKKQLDIISLEKALQRPQYYPMLVPPRNWETVTGGCYLTKAVSKNVNLVTKETQGQRRLLKNNLVSGKMKPYLTGVDILGKTPLAINSRMIEVIQFAYENNHSLKIKKFIVDEEVEIPEKIKNDRENFFNRLKALDLKHSIESQRSQFHQDIHTAKTYSGKTFYLPHRADFRGRVYPISPFSHHRGDHIRSLIWSAVGKPLGDQGLYWLKYAIATAGDFDNCTKKLPDDRVKWTMDNLEFIFDCAEFWKTKLDWAKADKPFTFLNYCMELTLALMSDNPVKFNSKVFMNFDGSCSGQQHFSASLRSEEGLLVNLGPANKVGDLYSAVVDQSNEYLDRAWSQKAQFYQQWKKPILKLIEAGSLTRSIVKRNTMTFGYSSKKFGFKEQILEDLMRPIETQVRMGLIEENPYAIDNDGGFAVAGLIAELNWKSVNKVVKDTSGAMQWLTQVAGALAHEGKPLIFDTPLGFPVVHAYYQWQTHRVRGIFGGAEVPVMNLTTGTYSNITQLSMLAKLRPTEIILKDKAKSSVAPNVIHSMDATHLIMVTRKGAKAGIRDQLHIHDSFGCLMADATKFQDIIRCSFVELYEKYDIYDALLGIAQNQISSRNRHRLPTDIPAKGSLDLRGVLKSKFAFS